MLNSLEIAEITGKTHRNVKRDIKNLDAHFGQIKISMVFPNGRDIEVYELSDAQIEQLKYGNYIKSEIRVEELESKVKVLDAHFGQMKKDLQQVKEENIMLKQEIFDLKTQFEKYKELSEEIMMSFKNKKFKEDVKKATKRKTLKTITKALKQITKGE